MKEAIIFEGLVQYRNHTQAKGIVFIYPNGWVKLEADSGDEYYPPDVIETIYEI